MDDCKSVVEEYPSSSSESAAVLDYLTYGMQYHTSVISSTMVISLLFELTLSHSQVVWEEGSINIYM